MREFATALNLIATAIKDTPSTPEKTEGLVKCLKSIRDAVTSIDDNLVQQKDLIIKAIDSASSPHEILLPLAQIQVCFNLWVDMQYTYKVKELVERLRNRTLTLLRSEKRPECRELYLTAEKTLASISLTVDTML
jgi:hypothetical protein